jgi:hypothetical protein
MLTIQANKTQRIDSISSREDLFDSEAENKKNLEKDHSAVRKKQRKTLLKIVKRNKSTRENSLPSESSFDDTFSSSVKAELFKVTANEILTLMDSVDAFLKIR